MATIVINDKNDFFSDSRRRKARAIVLDENNCIYVCDMGGCFMLPGGGIEVRETAFDTITRELYEELGTIYYDSEYFLTVKYFHENYPRPDGSTYQTRLNIVYYFICRVSSSELGIPHFTQHEKKHKIKIRKLKIEELISTLGESSNNPYKRFIDKETKVILDIYLNNLDQVKSKKLTKGNKNVKINS